MSCSENPVFLPPLHQTRVSQIPLRPSAHTAVNIFTRNAFTVAKISDHRSKSPAEMQSSLDHARYNIVGKFSDPFLSLSLADDVRNRETTMQSVYHQASSCIDGVWCTDAQDR